MIYTCARTDQRDHVHFFAMAEGGYDYDFLEPPPDRVTCKICHLPCFEAEKSRCCGHVFCKEDLEKLKSSSRDYACPMCRVKPLKTYPDLAIDREINELRIYCPYSRDGCKWSGELADLEDHLNKGKNCVMRRCSKCKSRIHHTALTAHISKECPCHCQYCGITASRETIREQHKENCQKFPLTCPNICGLDNILRCDMKKHKKVCPLEMVSCNYCGVKVARKDEETHKKESVEHVMLMCESVYADIAHKQSADLKKSVDEITRCNAACLNKVENLIRYNKACANKTEDNSVWKINMAENFTNLNDKLDRYAFFGMIILLVFAFTVFGQLHVNKENTECDEIPLFAPVVLKMSGFTEKMKNSEQWNSSPFFAFWKGYQMSLRVDANGNGNAEGTHISTFLFLMKGPYDDELAEPGLWPLRGTFTIELLNQSNDDDHHTRTVQFNSHTSRECTDRVVQGDRASSGWGTSHFISHEDIFHRGKYLKNNILYFRISYEL